MASERLTALMAVALAFGVACAPADPDPRPPLILVSLDTVRADHLGVYGHMRDATPQLDAFAAVATRFDRAYAPGPWTYTSHVEMLTGRVPQEIGVTRNATPIPEGAPILAEPLAAAGYATAAFVDSRRRGFVGKDRGFGRGFDEFHHAPHREGLPFEYDVRVTFEEGAAWIERQGRGRPFFLFLHTKTAHKVKEEWAHESDRNPPYDVPSERFRFVDEQQARDPWQHPELGVGGAFLRALSDAYIAGDLSPDEFPEERLATLEALYDGALYRIDEAFGKLLEELRRLGLYDAALIVVTSDHGEEFLEHGQFNHRQLYQENTRVPLLVKFPGQREGQVVTRNVRLADVVPTLLVAAGLAPSPDLGGVVLDASGAALDPERPIFGAQWKPQRPAHSRRQQLSLRRGDWALIARGRGEAGPLELSLYDTRRDPEERSPVTDRPELTARLWILLERWHASWPESGEAPFELDDATREHLQALGYGDLL